VSTATFFSGQLPIIVFSLYLNWSPVATGSGTASLIPPSIALPLRAAAVLTRVKRSSLLEELNKDYVCTAGKRLETIGHCHGHIGKTPLFQSLPSSTCNSVD
jgi:ABC-type dipeptide/oligopeptide/nickel transport system permease component